MRMRAFTAAGLMLALTACATTGGTGNAVQAKWVGRPAGAFFAQFGPPNSDSAEGKMTAYSWRGGYKTRTTPAQYEQLDGGKRGKMTARARTEYLSCSVRLKVSDDYVIRDVEIVADRPGLNGQTYCEEFLAGA